MITAYPFVEHTMVVATTYGFPARHGGDGLWRHRSGIEIADAFARQQFRYFAGGGCR